MKSYWSYPGRQTYLLDAICEIFHVCHDEVKGKKRNLQIVYAKHFQRYVYERLDVNNEITLSKRGDGTKFLFALAEIGGMLSCSHCNIIASSRTCTDLMTTDQIYRAKCESILDKIKNKMIAL